MTFSDNESTGTESEQEQDGGDDTSQDETWLLSMMQPLDAWMRLSTPVLYHKWRAFSNLTMMYHRAARDLRADLESDELQLHLLREMCHRMEAEKESVQAMLCLVAREKEDVQARLMKVEAQMADTASSCVLTDELHRWELVDSLSDDDA